MGDPRGFLKFERRKGTLRPVAERLCDFAELDSVLLPEVEQCTQAARCMDCGVPFCHSACPLNNLIPEWNERIYRGDIAEVARALLHTNNFPELTSRVCPAPCEASCVLSIDGAAVNIKDLERRVSAHLEAAPARPQPPAVRRARRVAIVGSGPAGLAAAQQLARLGYDVTVFEKSARPGGLLRYGIPDFKLEKRVLDWRLAQLVAEGVRFECGVDVGVKPSGPELCAGFDALLLAVGAARPRDLCVPGRTFAGVHLAMEFLSQQNRRVSGEGLRADETPLVATGKRVVILGGGDTGADCLGTALRQGAASVLQLELLPRPPDARRPDNPWPEWPRTLRSTSSHEEGGVRDFSTLTKEVLGEDGHVTALRSVRVLQQDGALQEIAGSEQLIPCDLVLLAMGFLGPEPTLAQQLGLTLDGRGNLAVDARGMTCAPGVFAAGDATRGASLVVTAIAEGRKLAFAVHHYLDPKQANSSCGSVVLGLAAMPIT